MPSSKLSDLAAASVLTGAELLYGVQSAADTKITVDQVKTFLSNLTLDDATANGVSTVLTLTHTTSGTPAAGIGAGLNFTVETAVGNNEIGAAIQAVTTDVTATSEDFDLVFKTMVAGAAADERGRFTTIAGFNALHIIGSLGNANITAYANIIGCLNDNNSLNARLGPSDMSLPSTAIFGFSAGSNPLGAGSDTILARDAAGIFAQRNSTNAQTLRVYNTYTDSGNYERGIFDWTTTANALTIGMQAAGTGTARSVKIGTAPGASVYIGDARFDEWTGGQGVWHATGDATQYNHVRVIGWVDTNIASTGTRDTGLTRNAAGIVEINNGIGGGSGALQLNEMAAPGNPAANGLRIYALDDGGVTKLATKDSAGTQTILGSGALAGFSSNGTTLSGSAQTVTTSSPILDLSQTWNAGAVTFTGIKANITNTASAGASLLMDLQTGGASMFGVTVAGKVLFAGAFVGNSGAYGITSSGAGKISFTNSTFDTYITAEAATFSGLLDDATADAVSTVLSLTHTTSGTPAAGIGTGINFITETSAGNNEIGAVIEAVATDVTATSEDFDLVFKTMAAGAAAAEVVRMKSTGIMEMGPAAGGQFLKWSGGPRGIGWVGGGVALYGDAGIGFTANSSGVTLPEASPLIWGEGGLINLYLYKEQVSGTDPALAIRNGTNKQTLRVYNTYTDASNYERGVFDWGTTANTLTIGTQAAGTGSNRSLRLLSAAAPIAFVVAGGNYISVNDGFMSLHTSAGIEWNGRQVGLNQIDATTLGVTTGDWASTTLRDIKVRKTLVPVTGTLTIATGAVTATGGYHLIDTEAAAATDDLDTINGGSDGQLLVIRAADSARSVVAKDGTGNLQLAGDMTLDNAQDTLTLFYVGALTAWLELSRSDNGA